MKRNAMMAGMLVLLLLSGCAESPTGPEKPVTRDAAIAEEPEDMMSMEGISLYLTDTRAQAGVARKPKVTVHADRFEALDNGALRLEGVEGRIFGPTGEEALSFTARGGRFNEADRDAFLDGDVRARAGELSIQLEDLRWREPAPDQPGLAESDGPARLEKDGLRLDAKGLKLWPDSGTFELGDVRGTVSLRSLTP